MKTRNLQTYIDNNRPESNIINGISKDNVYQLLLEKNKNILKFIPVSTDSKNTVISWFTDLLWDLWPYQGVVGHKTKSILSFYFLKDFKNLLNEVTSISLVWLKIRGQIIYNKTISVNTAYTRINCIKQVTSFLIENNYSSITDLFRKPVFSEFENYIISKNLSMSYIQNIYITINSTILACKILNLSSNINYFNSRKKAIELSRIKKDYTQTFAIPSRIMNLIYNDVYSLIEFAWPHRDKLKDLRQKLFNNYLLAKKEVDDLIDGHLSNGNDLKAKITQKDRSNNTEKYRNAITYRQKSPEEIAEEIGLPSNLRFVHEKKLGWSAYLNLLRTACYICILAFSGMRASDSFSLTPESYAQRIIGGKMFHVLRGVYTKLRDGPKHDEWICSPISGKALKLAASISDCFRGQLLDAAKRAELEGNFGLAKKHQKESRCLWLSQRSYRKLPTPLSVNTTSNYLKKIIKLINPVILEEDLAEFHILNKNVPQLEIPKLGEYWPLRNHQTRRSFAVFATRNNTAGTSAIKQQFKHLKPRLTLYYGQGADDARLDDINRDHELIELLNDARIDFQTDELFQIYNSSETLAGGRGKSITKSKQSGGTLFQSWEQLRKLVAEGKLTYHSTGTGGCANGYNCSMEAIINPAFCVECDGAIIRAEHAQNWSEKHQAAIRHLTSKPGISPSEYSHFSLLIRAAERVMEALEIPFDSFDGQTIGKS